MAIATVGTALAAVTLAPLHQDGKYIKDPTGKVVNLHGVMDTPNAYFNGNRWQLDWGGGQYNSQKSLQNCLNYFNTYLPGLNDRNKSYCNLFRLHLDPAWTNDPSKTAKNGGGENDISRFSATRLSQFMDKLYWPITMKALESGMYVIMRPPGVCPQQISVQGEYYNYLMTVWDIVSKYIVNKGMCGQVMIELANEPIQILNKYGQRTDNAPHDFFQPIVDMIRRNGYTGIILVPGEGYQSQYEKYSKNPITGSNIGYAVHYYPGWYGTHDNWYAPETTLGNFKKQVPVVDQRPIVVTEIDWSPEKQPKVLDHYNEFGQAVYKNYGTWGTATTSKWGNEFKYVHDKCGNISMTLQGAALYLDIDRYLKDRYVQPAFLNQAQPDEACAKPCFDWYKSWNQYVPQNAPANTGSNNTGSSNTGSTSGTSVDASSMFSLTNGSFNPQIHGDGWYYYNPDTKLGCFAAGQYGFGGWQNANGFDVSQYKSITVEIYQPRTGDVSLRVFTKNDYWDNSACIQAKFNGTTKATIDLSNINKLYIVGFWDYGNTDLSNPTNKIHIKSITMERKPIDDSNQMFSLSNGSFNASIWETGKYSWDGNSGIGTFYAGQYGFGGWKKDSGYDVSGYKSITVTLAEAPSSETAFRVFTVNNYWASGNGEILEAKFNGGTTATIDLSNVNRLYIAGFWNWGNTNGNWTRAIKIKSVRLTAGSSNTTTQQAPSQVWDFSQFGSNTVILAGNNYHYNYSGLNLTGYPAADYTKDFVSKSGFHCNGSSAADRRYFSYKAAGNGTLTVYFRSNNTSDQSRLYALGTAVGSAIAQANCGTGRVTINVNAGQTYYGYIVSGGITVTRVEFNAGAKAAPVRDLMDEDETTDIQTLSIDSDDAPCFNLNGMKVNGQPKGLIIRGGKKILIR